MADYRWTEWSSFQLGLWVGGHLAPAHIHSSDPSDLWQWLCAIDDSTISIFLVLLLLLLLLLKKYCTYEYLTTRSGYGWLASVAVSCATAIWYFCATAGDDAHSWVPAGTTSADCDRGLSGRITSVKHDFVCITVSGIVCSTVCT